MNELQRNMEKRGIRPRISLGQNFLLDDSLLESLAALAGVGPDSRVLEIGAGTGALTRVLATRAESVLALEIDTHLEPLLRENLASFPNAHIEMGDAMQADLSSLAREHLGGVPQVVANLPYYITTPLLVRLLSMSPPPAAIAVMVQKEVGEKMLAAPGSKQYGPLAVFCRDAYQVSVGRIVPAGAFYPPPKVDSAFMLLSPYPAGQQPMRAQDAALFSQVVHAAFAMRRKTLQNNLMAALAAGRPETAAWIMAAGLPETVRGEALSIEQFVILADVLHYDRKKP